MYLLIYSIDYQDYIDRCDDEPWVQEGEKQYIVGTTKEACIEDLLKEIGKYDDDIYDAEYYYLKNKQFPCNCSYLIIHDFYKIDSILEFDIKGTQQYKDFVEKQHKYKQNQQQEAERLLEERELAELQRLKDKYE